MSQISENLVSRQADFHRHLEDLRTSSYQGARERPDKETTFANAADLLAPVACRVLEDFNRSMLAASGEITDTGLVHAEDGTAYREWRLSWPGQRGAKRRVGEDGPVEPVIIRAHFPPGWTHGHLASPTVGNWPLQILDERDANRQALIIWAIAEAELHQRIFESVHPWDCVPSPVGYS